MQDFGAAGPAPNTSCLAGNTSLRVPRWLGLPQAPSLATCVLGEVREIPATQ